jgi:hypothetical protein
MMYPFKKGKALVLLLQLSILLVVLLSSSVAKAAFLTMRSVQLDDPIANTITNYKIGFSITTPGSLGSIQLEFCSNSPLNDVPCVAPAGFDISSAVLSSQTGETGFIISPSSTVNNLILTRAAIASLTGPVTYSFTGVKNPSAVNTTAYVRMLTYASVNATGIYTDLGGAAFSTSGSFGASAFVPPHIDLCVGITVASDCSSTSGDRIELGVIVPTKASFGTSQAAAATNSPTGYALYSLGSTLTSGNNLIPRITNPNPSVAGIGQFGINLRKNNNPQNGLDITGVGSGQVVGNYNTPDLYMFNSGDEIAQSPLPSEYNVYTISYLVNISVDQHIGVYSTTITIMAVAQF